MRVNHLRAPPVFDEKGPGDFEEQVADEEEPEAEAEDAGREVQRRFHLQFGEAGVGAIEVGNDVHAEEERQQPPGRLCAGRIVRSDRRGWP